MRLFPTLIIIRGWLDTAPSTTYLVLPAAAAAAAAETRREVGEQPRLNLAAPRAPRCRNNTGALAEDTNTFSFSFYSHV